MKILVTGATGKVGSSLVTQLAAKGAPIRAMTRAPASACFPDGVEVAPGHPGDPHALKAALAGVDRVFFMSPDVSLPAQAASLARLLPESDVSHVVMLSSLAVEISDGAQSSPLTLEHRDAETIMGDAVRTCTFLRAGVFHSNTLTWAPSIRGSLEVRSILTNDPYAPIDPADIASAAAEVLTGNGPYDSHYGLTGDEEITPSQQAAVLSELLGRQIKFIELPERQAREIFFRAYPSQSEQTLHTLRQPGPPWAKVRDDLHRLIDRPALTYSEWAQRNLHSFMP